MFSIPSSTVLFALSRPTSSSSCSFFLRFLPSIGMRKWEKKGIRNYSIELGNGLSFCRRRKSPAMGHGTQRGERAETAGARRRTDGQNDKCTRLGPTPAPYINSAHAVHISIQYPYYTGSYSHEASAVHRWHAIYLTCCPILSIKHSRPYLCCLMDGPLIKMLTKVKPSAEK